MKLDLALTPINKYDRSRGGLEKSNDFSSSFDFKLRFIFREHGLEGRLQQIAACYLGANIYRNTNVTVDCQQLPIPPDERQ